MSSGTAGASSSQAANQGSSGTSGRTEGPVIVEPPVPVTAMRMPERPPPANITVGPNISTHVIRTNGRITDILVEDHDARVPLGKRIQAEARDFTERAVNCCLGCTCKVCCGI